MAALKERVVARGVPLAFFRGVRSTEPTLDGMRQSSGGSALHAAIALCRAPVDVFGVGLFSAEGVAGDKVYTHSYDAGVGRCVGVGRAARFANVSVERFERRRWASKSSWREQRVRSEMMMHILHNLGVVRWRQ